MVFLLKFILENGRIDWSKAPEIIAGPAWKEFCKSKSTLPGFEMSFFTYVTYKHPLGKRIYNNTVKKHGYFKNQNITFDEILIKAKLINSEINIGKRVVEWTEESAVQTIINEVLPEFKKIENPSFSFFTYATTLNNISMTIFYSCTQERGVLFKQGVVFQDILEKVKVYDSQIDIEKKFKTPNAEKTIHDLATVVWNDYLIWKKLDGNDKSFYYYASRIHDQTKNIYNSCTQKEGSLKKQGVSFDDLLLKAKEINPEIEIDRVNNRLNPEDKQKFISALAFNIWNLFLISKNGGYRGDFFTYSREKNIIGKRIYSSCKNGSLGKAGIKFVDLLKEAKVLNPEISFHVMKKNQFRIRPDLIKVLARVISKKIWKDFQKEMPVHANFLTYIASDHVLGKKIWKSIHNYHGQLKRLGINFSSLMQEVGSLNPEVTSYLAIHKKKLDLQRSVTTKKTLSQKRNIKLNDQSKFLTRREIKPSKPLKIDMEISKFDLTEKEKDRNKIKKLWPEYLKEKKYGTTALLFRDYVKVSEVGTELVLKYADFDVFLDETIKQIVEPVVGVESSSEAYFKFMKVLAQRIEFEKQAR